MSKRKKMLNTVKEARALGFRVGTNINFYSKPVAITGVKLFKWRYDFESKPGALSYSPPMEGVGYPCIGIYFEIGEKKFLYPISKVELM